ncbi:MAG: hypothetical protein SPI03_01765 [Campylobacter sputorum]|uniref:hypothetical protein n=1 Tax=Campylobacter sputorum TaxID=206 RepID=UPI000B76EFC0|nr:hypothetical protein [Campylobacter sputorum]ASM38210.1 hypothetical protein CSPARA_0622 [Campylobacter sputorum bv. paraureolyticus LMG 11764]MDY6120055.1 hypothetical protein [Campylobacter sputorum]
MKKFILVLFLAINLQAYYCYAPIPPICLQSYGSFDYSFCKIQTENYLRELNDYYDCVLKEKQRELEELAEQINKAKQNAIEVFNCKASGNCR